MLVETEFVRGKLVGRDGKGGHKWHASIQRKIHAIAAEGKG